MDEKQKEAFAEFVLARFPDHSYYELDMLLDAFEDWTKENHLKLIHENYAYGVTTFNG